MIRSLKNDWREFTGSEPGSRFKDRYYRRQKDNGEGRLVVKVFYIILGTVIAIGSLFTAPLPGPGFATVLLGLAILGGELLPAARFLDWAELRLRALWRFTQGVWRSGLAGKVAVIVVVAALAGAFFYVAYLLLFAQGDR